MMAIKIDTVTLCSKQTVGRGNETLVNESLTTLSRWVIQPGSTNTDPKGTSGESSDQSESSSLSTTVILTVSDYSDYSLYPLENVFVNTMLPTICLPLQIRGFIKILWNLSKHLHLDIICMANIMILAQVVFQVFCSQGPLWLKCLRLKRRII